MNPIHDRIRPFLANQVLKYVSLGYRPQDVPLTYFEKSFTLLATSEKPQLDQYTYFYQHLDNTELVMRIRIKGMTFAANLQPYQEIETQLKVV
jgi:hypothetical protein